MLASATVPEPCPFTITELLDDGYQPD